MLEATEEYRAQEKLPANTPLAYAGRLDPMAEGKLLILIGDECKKLKAYTGLDKEYSFEILFGFSSDTGDVLGLATKDEITKMLTKNDVRRVTKKFVGTHTFPYPRFSSKTVQGKPLHRWALEGRLDEIKIPVRESRIYRIEANDMCTVKTDELQKTIYDKIQMLAPVTDPEKAWGADFRRGPIMEQWENILKNSPQDTFYIARMSAIVSSGTYIRTLAEKIAETLGTHGLAYSITREKIGKYVSFGPVGFWMKSF